MRRSITISWLTFMLSAAGPLAAQQALPPVVARASLITARRVVQDIRDCGGHAVAVRSDAGIESDVVRAFAEADREGPLAILVLHHCDGDRRNNLPGETEFIF